MEASTAPETPVADPRPQRPAPTPPLDLEGREAVKAASAGVKLSEPTKMSALEWFLTDEEDNFTHTMELNVGSPRQPKWIEWVMKPVDLETLKRIRKQAAPKKGRRGNNEPGEIDEVEANLRIVIEGTVEPDLLQIAQTQGIVDPADVLRRRFQHKPGLLGQIAGEIMGISGYDDEDVREIEAAGNS